MDSETASEAEETGSGSEDITDDEFEGLLDDIHGKGQHGDGYHQSQDSFEERAGSH